MKTTFIYRVAIVNINFEVISYLPDFYSTKESAKEAIKKAINIEPLKGWNKQNWEKHPWQECNDKQCGRKCIEMVKTAEYKDNLNNKFFRGYGFITYTLI